MGSKMGMMVKRVYDPARTLFSQHTRSSTMMMIPR
jgi:hypothetical protein